MRLKHFLLFACIILVRFSNVSANSVDEERIFQVLEMSYAISEKSPEIIKDQDPDKFYLKNSRISPTEQGAYLLLDNGQQIHLPLGFVFYDHEGYFLPASHEILTKKPFKNVCLDCEYEWEGGVFTFRCPKCHSFNIVNVPS